MRSLLPPYDFIPNKGFGLKRKDFISREKIPDLVQQAVSGAVRKVCVCEASPYYCATFFAFEEASQFITNEHVASEFFDKMQESIVEYKKNHQKCSPEVFSIEPDGSYSPVVITQVKRGKYKPKDTVGPKELWNPKEYYKSNPDDHSEDLAVFSIKGLKATVTPLKVARELRKGQAVYLAGYSAAHLIDVERAGKDYFPQVSSGELIDIKEKNLECDVMGVPGMSGGPLLDEAGALQGVFWGKKGTLMEEGNFFNVDGREWVRRHGHPRERAYFIPLDKVRSFVTP